MNCTIIWFGLLNVKLLSVFTVERAADDEPPHLARPGADLVELAVAHDPARRVVVDVPVAAQDLVGQLKLCRFWAQDAEVDP